MKPTVWAIVFAPLLALRLCAQGSLDFFTNEANDLLTSKFDFGVTNIPAYSTTNAAMGYTAAIHYALQSAANDYDATTPATNLPSVFRPLFSWQGDTLFIVGYTNVTTDFVAQISLGFKEPGDPTIGPNDNVWGIPWVVGQRNSVPTFNEYCYSSTVLVERELLFARWVIRGVVLTNRPPQYTNQFYLMAITNTFGVEAWNSARAAFTNSVTIIESNQVSIMLTNNFNWGTNVVINAGTNWAVNSWPGWQGGQSDPSFLTPLFTNVVGLPSSYWSDSTAEFVPFTNWIYFNSNSFSAADMRQTGWPYHYWTLSITNNLMYALVDNASGQGLDFVNLGAFGNAFNINQALNNLTNPPPVGGNPWGTVNYWDPGVADDLPNSPMSAGDLYQIEEGILTNQGFANSLLGTEGSFPVPVFSDPYIPAVIFFDNCSWQAANPWAHSTVEDLSPPQSAEEVLAYSISPIGPAFPPGIGISNLPCSLGRLNPSYHSGAIFLQEFSLSDGVFQIGFRGMPDLPYALWATTNLLDWTQVGTALQPSPGLFQFTDPGVANHPACLYEVRSP